MNIGFYLVIGIIVVGLIAYNILSKSKKEASFGEKGIPLGMEELYELAVNPGSDGKPLLYNLTTCKHCVRVHNFLDQYGIEHNDITVDHFGGQAKADIVAKLRTYNPRVSFPTLVFPDGQVVVGFRESALLEIIGIDKEKAE